jgi:hypothetical protein
VAAKEVVSDLYQFSNRGINAFLIDEGDDGRSALGLLETRSIGFQPAV